MRTKRMTSLGDTTLTIDEAVAIASHAESGTLDQSDPDVRRLVGEARQLIVRTQMWGEVPTRHQRRARRFLAVGLLITIAVWVGGLLIPVLLNPF